MSRLIEWEIESLLSTIANCKGDWQGDKRYKPGTMLYQLQEIYLNYKSRGIVLGPQDLATIWEQNCKTEFEWNQLNEERRRLIRMRQNLEGRIDKNWKQIQEFSEKFLNA